MGRRGLENHRRANPKHSSRYGAIDYNGVRVMGFNNIELISDRPSK